MQGSCSTSEKRRKIWKWQRENVGEGDGRADSQHSRGLTSHSLKLEMYLLLTFNHTLSVRVTNLYASSNASWCSTFVEEMNVLRGKKSIIDPHI